MSDSVGSVSVDVVPDARGWSEKLRAQIRDKSVKVKADAETGEAEAKLDEVARTRTAKVKADVSQLSKGASALDNFVGKLGLLPALAIAGSAALIPLAATLGGLAAALAAPLAIAGGGATLFAFLGGAAIKETLEAQKKVDQLHKNVVSAQTALTNATRSAGKHASTSASVAAAQERLNKATRDYRTALSGMSPQQGAFVSALESLKSTFSGIVNGPTGRALLQPFTEGLGLLAYVLKAIAPFIRASADAFSTMFGEIRQAVNDPSFEKFVHRLAHEVGPDLVTFGHIAGNGLKGIATLLLGVDGALSGKLLKGLERLSSSFADWASSKDGRHDVKKFFDYVHQVGPQVADTVGAIARGAGHFVKALAPLGPPVLKIVQGLADAFSSIPIPVLTALAGATAGLVAFQKLGGFKAAGLLTKGLGGGGGVTGLLTGGVQKVFVVNMGAGGLGGAGGEGGFWKNALKKGAPGAGTAEGALALTAPEAAGYAALFGAGVVGEGFLLHQVRSGGKQWGQQSVSPPGMFGHNTGYVDKPGQNHFQVHLDPANGPIATNSFLRDLKKSENFSAFDVLRTHAQQASREIDQIGPHAHNAFAAASKDVAAFNDKLNSIHDHKFAIIAQTQSAISSLERLQAYRIRDKSFTVYQRSQLIDQAVGPGGGRGRATPGGSKSGDGGGASGRTPVHIHLDDKGRTTLDGYVQGHAQDVYDANQRYQGAHG